MVASRSSPIGTYTVLAFMLVGAFVAMVALLGPMTVAPQRSVPYWLPTNHIAIPKDLTITAHATKHQVEQLNAETIYAMLLEGKCAASAKYCNPNGTVLYLCLDPISGVIGGLFVVGDAVATGYSSGEQYWSGLVRGDDAPFKGEFCYVH